MPIAPAHAAYGYSSGQTDSRLDQLEKQIQTLSRSVYRGEKMPEGALAAETAAISAYDARVGQIEGQQRDMTGKIERLEYDVQQIKDRLDKLSIDLEQRFQQLETSGATTGSVTPPQPASTTVSAGDPASPVPAPSTSGVLGSTNDGATSLYESAFSDIRSSKFDAAETKLKQFMAQYPKHKLAGNAQYWLAETHYVKGDYAGAAQMFAQGYQSYPQGTKAPDSLLKLGLSLSKLGKKEDACLSFGQLQKQFPGDNTVSGRATQEMKSLGCQG